MKRVLTVVLVFAVVLAVLLGASALWERLRPAREEAVEEPAGERKTVSNVMDAAGATVITLAQGGSKVSGFGAEAAGDRVTIAYPGTYRVEGALEDGQIVVDLGDFSGAAYLILNGASVSCGDGPALHVKQADLTAVYLAEGTENALRDGADYLVAEGQDRQTGAAIYSEDDLLLWGEGALTVTGSSADGIRSKDALYLAGGTLRVYAADDGLQASDLLEIYDGDITVSCWGDGFSTTEGYITVYGGSLSVRSGGDGVAAMTELSVQGGTISAVTYGGPANYGTIALGDLSAKGLKGETVTISGGDIDLYTADDGIHAGRDAAITGGTFAIAAGDDGICAAGALEVRDVSLNISECYEGLEGGDVRLSNAALAVTAQNNAVDAGEGGITGYATQFTLTAPRALSSEGVLDLLGCEISLHADGTDSLFSFGEAELIGCTVAAAADTGRSEVLLAEGRLPGSLLFGFSEPIPAGTRIVLTDHSGAEVYAVSFENDAGAFLLALDGLMDGQPYTMTAGEQSVEFTYEADGSFVSEPEPVMASRGGFPGFPGMPRR